MEAVVARTGAAKRSATWRGNPAEVASRTKISRYASEERGGTGGDDDSSLGRVGPVVAEVSPDGPQGSKGPETTARLANWRVGRSSPPEKRNSELVTDETS